MINNSGPWVYSAAICEEIVKNPNGSRSIMGVTNHIRLALEIEGEGLPEFTVAARLKMALGLTSGKALGRAQVKLTREGPDGLTQPSSETSVHFRGGDQGELLDLAIDTNFTQEGTYWFCVLVDDVLVTRVPFRLDLHVTRYPKGSPPPRTGAPPPA